VQTTRTCLLGHPTNELCCLFFSIFLGLKLVKYRSGGIRDIFWKNQTQHPMRILQRLALPRKWAEVKNLAAKTKLATCEEPLPGVGMGKIDLDFSQYLFGYLISVN